jgi:hypothetical protein
MKSALNLTIPCEYIMDVIKAMSTNDATLFPSLISRGTHFLNEAKLSLTKVLQVSRNLFRYLLLPFALKRATSRSLPKLPKI